LKPRKQEKKTKEGRRKYKKKQNQVSYSWVGWQIGCVPDNHQYAGDIYEARPQDTGFNDSLKEGT